MAKHALDESSPSHKPKKTKLGDNEAKHKSKNEPLTSTSNLVQEEVDFPRGGGTTLTALEVRNIKAEAVREADEELFKDSQQKVKHKKRKSISQDATGDKKSKADKIRVESLNYKRLTVGTKVLGQIVYIQPLALVVSLPNQLFAHVPITHISSQLTQSLESLEQSDEEEQDESDSEAKPRVPDLFEIFHSGQYVRAVVTAVHAYGSSDQTGIGKSRDQVIKASRRVELSLVPERVNAGVHKADLRSGFTLTAAVKSAEDHGYILDFGLSEVSGFISFKEAEKGPFENSNLHIGQLLDVCVAKMSANGRICTVSVDQELFASSSLSEITNVTSIIPGTLVQALVTAVQPHGLNLQILGYFEGTIDQFHLPFERAYKLGQKVKCRVLYDVSTAPTRFALALVDHILKLQIRRFKGGDKSKEMPIITEAYPIGTVLEAVKVIRVEAERGLVVEVQPGVGGFVHISHTSDEHVPSLSPSSGSWKVGTVHRARVTGYFHFDGILQLSFRPSVLEEKYLQVDDVQVGEVIRGTIKKLNDSGLFVSVSENIDGVVWPNHYADIALKHPSKRFKAGGHIKCRALIVDPERKRIVLTAKKTLVESTLPVLSTFDDAKVGLVAHATVLKATEKSIIVEFYNNLRGVIPIREVSETLVGPLPNAFPPGKVIKARIISRKPDNSQIVASIRQAASSFNPTVTDISGVEIGNIVEGVVAEIHKDNAVLTLQPSQARALISLQNLANHRGIALPQLRTSLKTEDKLTDLVVVSRNPEKGLVIVASKPKSKAPLAPKSAFSINRIAIGQIIGGRVTRHARNGAYVKVAAHTNGSLHPTDTCDDYEAGSLFPAIDTVLKAAVIGIDKEKKLVTLSTRPSRMHPDEHKSISDPEVGKITDLKVGATLRGFIKSVSEHGLFVSIGRDIDARVQIKELFDEYIKEWQDRFKANQVVKGRILSIDIEKKKVEMTFRSGDLNSSSRPTLSDFHEGQKVDGTVKKIEDYGIFIEIEGSKVSGLCHKSELSDNKDANVTLALRSFREGDRVKTIIISINTEKRQISLGLKPSYFSSEDITSDAASSDEEAEEEQAFGIVDEDEDMADEASNSDDGDADIMDIDTEQLEQTASQSHQTGPSTIAPAPSLRIQGGFQWSANGHVPEEDPGSESPSDESNVGGQGEEKKKRKRRQIEQDLTADMHKKTPESNADFERLLLGSPNSSFLWIQYMSFQLQISEIEKAREIGKRALHAINFREEQEKLNVWIALLNLENMYGTDDSLEATFKDAARHNDSKTIHLRLAHILDESEKHDKAEEQYKRTCKKFGQSSKVWALFAEHYIRRGDLEQARGLLSRSLQSLEKRKHLKTISKFAQLEYKLGDPERGKTIFEGIVESHPRRWDIWSIYMDMEAGQGQIQSLRNLFDRVLVIKMTSHKAKAFFKKWLDLERKIGDEDGANVVKQKAVEWTQRAANNNAE